MYYVIVMIAVLLFGLQFFCNGQYEKASGSSVASSMLMIVGSIWLCLKERKVKIDSYYFVKTGEKHEQKIY